MSGTSGRTSLRQFAFFDPDSSCWRTWPAISLWGSETFSGTLPKRGSMRSGRLFERATSGPAISAPDSSSSPRTLPTPVANDDHKRPEAHLAAKVRSGAGEVITSLDVMARQAAEAGLWSHKLLPTPVTGYTGSTVEEWRARRPAGNGASRETVGDLGLVVKMLPTPTSAAGAGGNLSRSGDRGDELLLPGLVKTFLPTPRTGPNRASRKALTMKHWSAPALEQAIELAQGQLPREYEDWSEVRGQSASLLPTPTASDAKGPSPNHSGTTAEAIRDLTGASTPPPSNGTPESSDDDHPPLWTERAG